MRCHCGGVGTVTPRRDAPQVLRLHGITPRAGLLHPLLDVFYVGDFIWFDWYQLVWFSVDIS